MGWRQSEVFGGIFHDRAAIVRDGFSRAAPISPTRSFPDPINTGVLPSFRAYGNERMGLPYLNGVLPSLPQDSPRIRITRTVAVQQRCVGLSVNVRQLAVRT